MKMKMLRGRHGNSANKSLVSGNDSRAGLDEVSSGKNLRAVLKSKPRLTLYTGAVIN